MGDAAARVPRHANDNDDIGAMPTPALIAAARTLAGGRRASVTLRLDPDRHMRLRMACAIGGRSAQAILYAALDAHLDTIPDLARLMAAAAIDDGEAAAAGRGNDI